MTETASLPGSDSDRHPPKASNQSEKNGNGGEFSNLVTLAVLCILLPLVAVAGSVLAVGLINRDILATPQVELPIVLIAAVLTLIGGLTFMVIVLHYLRLTTKGAALGMPDGSIRAVIAISLLFLFMILSVFLYANMAGSKDSTISSASADVAKQLITTVATLAVSVAGFYFGTSSVTAATKAVSASRAQPSLTIVSPTQAVTMLNTKDTASPEILVVAAPPDEAISWQILGDADGRLVQSNPGSFTYFRGTKPSAAVTLEFLLVGHPQVTARLQING